MFRLLSSILTLTFLTLPQYALAELVEFQISGNWRSEVSECKVYDFTFGFFPTTCPYADPYQIAGENFSLSFSVNTSDVPVANGGVAVTSSNNILVNEDYANLSTLAIGLGTGGWTYDIPVTNEQLPNGPTDGNFALTIISIFLKSGVSTGSNIPSIALDDIVSVGTQFVYIPYVNDSIGYTYLAENITVSQVPVPGAVWLFGSALGGLGWLGRKRAI